MVYKRSTNERPIQLHSPLRWPPQPDARNHLKRAWVNFLSHYRWSIVLTLTFGRDRHSFRCGQNPELADKAFRTLIRKVNENLYGNRWMSKSPSGGVVWARAHELQQDGTSHYHAVIFSSHIPITPSLLSELRAWWRARYGSAIIEPPRHNSSVLRYLVKHVGSPDQAEIDISHNFR